MKPILIALTLLASTPFAALAAGGEATMPPRPAAVATECVFQTGACAELQLRRNF